MHRWLIGLLLFYVNSAAAHQFQTLAIAFEEQTEDRVTVVFKSSVGREDRPSNVSPRLSPECEAVGVARQERLDELVLRTWTMHCPDGLQGRTLTLLGLGPTSPDAVVTVRYRNGQTLTKVLDRNEPNMQIGYDAASSRLRDLAGYLPIGIMHILTGPDHLLFVLCLMLVIAAMGFAWTRLFATITAFTLAHSLTLAASALYGLKLPSAPVEAVIALSILLLAVELAHRYRWPGNTPGLSLRYPALVAFAFGLLHGFGFAGALAQIGLPAAAEGWALLLFNLGVEAGQLLFVCGMLSLYWISRRVLQAPSPTLMPALVSIIGAVSAFWFIDRLLPVFVS